MHDWRRLVFFLLLIASQQFFSRLTCARFGASTAAAWREVDSLTPSVGVIRRKTDYYPSCMHCGHFAPHVVLSTAR
jgi:hypothetical protein